MAGSVTLRAAAPADHEFSARVYASTRASELEPVPWTDEQKQAFLRQQFEAQDISYREHYPDASFSIIELDGRPIGRLYLTRIGARDLRVIDIALLSEFTGRGIGTGLLREVFAVADAEQRSVSLHVEFWNPALRLYTHLGFVEAARNDVYIRMERPPAPPRAGQLNTAS